MAQQNAANQPPGYSAGYSIGCNSGYIAAGYKAEDGGKDVSQYMSNQVYKMGWDDGFLTCKSLAEAWLDGVYAAAGMPRPRPAQVTVVQPGPLVPAVAQMNTPSLPEQQAQQSQEALNQIHQQYLPKLNAIRKNDGRPKLSGNFQDDIRTMQKECADGFQGSCDFLKSAEAAFNQKIAMRQQQRAQQQFQPPFQGTAYRGLLDGPAPIPISPSDDCEARGIHGECTTEANRDAQIRRSTPNYGLGSGSVK
jgi:hypothetical protein